MNQDTFDFFSSLLAQKEDKTAKKPLKATRKMITAKPSTPAPAPAPAPVIAQIQDTPRQIVFDVPTPAKLLPEELTTVTKPPVFSGLMYGQKYSIMTPPEPEEDIETPDYLIFPYKKLSIVVRDGKERTKEIADDLKAIGGVFNYHLEGGAGWIFPKGKEPVVRSFLCV